MRVQQLFLEFYGKRSSLFSFMKAYIFQRHFLKQLSFTNISIYRTYWDDFKNLTLSRRFKTFDFKMKFEPVECNALASLICDSFIVIALVRERSASACHF